MRKHYRNSKVYSIFEKEEESNFNFVLFSSHKMLKNMINLNNSTSVSVMENRFS